MRKFFVVCILALAVLGSTASPFVHLDRTVLAHSQQRKGDPYVRVWVNTDSGVYHCPGTRWYGATKEGRYMTQKEAQDSGYRPAYGRYCE
jgi:hypothetical protein